MLKISYRNSLPEPYKCPVCGRYICDIPKHITWRQCPAYKEEAVCDECCKECRFRVKREFFPCVGNVCGGYVAAAIKKKLRGVNNGNTDK